jgi:hypothetical protein
MCFCLDACLSGLKRLCKTKREIITKLDHSNLDVSACTMAQIRCVVTSNTHHCEISQQTVDPNCAAEKA